MPRMQSCIAAEHSSPSKDRAFPQKPNRILIAHGEFPIIGMTAAPEAFLAREAEMCYAVMAHVTDYDVWHVSETPVTVDMVVQTLNKNTTVAQDAIRHLVRNLRSERDCDCDHALSDAIITRRESISKEARQKLDILIKKYI